MTDGGLAREKPWNQGWWAECEGSDRISGAPHVFFFVITLQFVILHRHVWASFDLTLENIFFHRARDGPIGGIHGCRLVNDALRNILSQK